MLIFFFFLTFELIRMIFRLSDCTFVGRGSEELAEVEAELVCLVSLHVTSHIFR